jgi:capsular polysaccharide export protein
MKLLENTMLYPPDLKFTDFNSYTKSINHKKLQVNPYKFDYALFAMQVPMDVNMIYHSPYYKNQLDILIDLHKHLPSNIKLVVREHPLYIGKYGKELYGFIESNEIIIDNASSLDEILENSSIVIVNNSTVGFEAICKYKPVVVLGNAYYDNERICLKLNNHSSLSEILKNALEKPVNKGEIDRFKETLYSSVMLMGGITNKQLLSAKTIAKHLISQ